MRKPIFLGVLVLAVLVGSISSFSSQLSQVVEPDPPRTAFVHLFEWTWNDVAQECETFLGVNGFAAVQVSPAAEHAVIAREGFPWWQRYQPVSYQIVSRSGDRAQFADMVSRCRAAGVQVYADAVINHMSGEASGVGSAGSEFTKYEYPGIYQPHDFHPCRQDIRDYGQHEQVTNCELVSLPDLNTGSAYVRDRLARYLLDLTRLGVAGFRIDAAKHIHPDDLGAILALVHQKADPDPYIFQEVIDPGTEAVRKSEYYTHGDVTEFEYGRKLGEAFLGLNGQTLAGLETLGESWGFAPSDRAIVFIDNHDKQRGHGGGGTYLTYKSGQLYDLANVFMLAFPYGYPQVMSSYEFTDADQGPPADAQGRTRSVYVNGKSACFGEWKCEHRRRAIAQMVGFRNATASRFEVTDWWSNGANQIAFGRGDRGFVIINRETQPLTRTFQTQLAPGTYCDVISGAVAGRGCSGTAIVVDRAGRATITAAAMDAIAIHVGTRLRRSF